MKLQKRKNKGLIIVAIVVAALLVLALIGVLVVPTIIKNVTKPDPSIAVSVAPKNVYFVGEKFDPTGLKIQVITGDQETTYFVSYPDADLKITGFDSSVANESLTLTITYKGMSTTMNVTIKDYPPKQPVLVSIGLSDAFYETPFTVSFWNRYGPTKRAGVSIVLTYDDGSTKEIPLKGEHCFNLDRNLTSAGTTEFILKYTEGGKTFEETITVTITE